MYNPPHYIVCGEGDLYLISRCVILLIMHTICVTLLVTQFVETVSRCVILLIMHGMSNPADYPICGTDFKFAKELLFWTFQSGIH